MISTSFHRGSEKVLLGLAILATAKPSKELRAMVDIHEGDESNKHKHFTGHSLSSNLYNISRQTVRYATLAPAYGPPLKMAAHIQRSHRIATMGEFTVGEPPQKLAFCAPFIYYDLVIYHFHSPHIFLP
jgi:hypothetical protein